jgi:uncharacterized metal-binding protein YceD (DUF177 family)
MIPELHRPIAVDRIGTAPLDVLVEATPAECAALASRMKLPELTALTCQFCLERDRSESLLTRGHLIAHVVRTCVVSLEDFAGVVEERFTVRFVEAGHETDNDDPESLDEIPFINGIVDLGEAAAEQLALALDPYPRAPGAEMPDISEEQVGHPFAGLERLSRRH